MDFILRKEITAREKKGNRAINDVGVNLVASFEGIQLNAYRDVVGLWTIGYGHVRGTHGALTITQQEALELLKEDLADTETTVDALTSDVPTTDSQFSALVCLCFAIGAGGFRISSVLKFHREKEYDLWMGSWSRSLASSVADKPSGICTWKNRSGTKRQIHTTRSLTREGEHPGAADSIPDGLGPPIWRERQRVGGGNHLSSSYH
jgi:GH24 family phage-related lysozyme (muramidase)